MSAFAGRLITLIATVLLASTCQRASPTFRPPNRDELQRFVRDQDVALVAERQWGETAVLLYESSTSFGFYTIRAHEPEGTLTWDNVSAAKSDQPILTIEQLTREQPIVAVLIQDQTLLARTTAVEVAIDADNRLTATTEGRAGAILISPSPVDGFGAVTLYNARGEVIYTKTGSLVPPVSEYPAAGICAPAGGETVTVEIQPDMPSPRCVQVTSTQRLKVVNRTNTAVQVRLGPVQTHLEPGTAHTVEAPFGSYLAPGVHVLQVNGGVAPELWLRGQGSTRMPSASLSGLSVEEHALIGVPELEPLVFVPVEGTQQGILGRHQAERDRRFLDWSYSYGKLISRGDDRLTALANVSGAYQSLSSVQVFRNGEVIYTAPVSTVGPIYPLWGLWAFDGHWVLEVAHASEKRNPQNESGYEVLGEIIRDGMSLNRQHGYREAFGFQLMAGKPFYFFERDGEIGISYDDYETALPYSRVSHYGCCSASELNPKPAENMVAFFAQRDGQWYYVEVGLFE